MAIERSSGKTTNLVLRCILFLSLSKFISCYTFPLPGARRIVRPVPIRRSSYFPVALTHSRSEYQLPDYDDEFMMGPQEEYEFNAYEKYPYNYYSGKDYYREKGGRDMGSLDGYEYVDDRILPNSEEEIPGDVAKGIYPYVQESWFEEEVPIYDSNAQANAAFLHNLFMAQMLQDAKKQKTRGYESTADDYDDQHWFYGVPTTEVEENEKVKQYFKNKEDEEVRELESLATKKNKGKILKEKESFKKQKPSPMIDYPIKPKSKMTDDQYFELQKQIVLKNRKNGWVPVAEGFRLSKKQGYDPMDVKNNFWDFQNGRSRMRYSDLATNSIKKLNVNKSVPPTKASEVSDSKTKIETTSTTAVTSTPSPKRPPTAGQKEVVLLRPSNPVRRPFPELSTRNSQSPSVYDTIKLMLRMDEDIQQKEISRPQKRFILDEDQLTAQLGGLKKSAA